MSMWSALKSDLLDFVNTIQEDTTKTLSRVLGDEEVEVEEENMLGKWIANTKRSYETYANPLRENRAREYERFRKRFALSSYTKEIGEVLDEEPEVSRFYAELVPLQISAEDFWSRLFFRLQLLSRTGNVNFEDDDEEEELNWEDDQVDDAAANAEPATNESEIGNKQLEGYIQRCESLETENKELKQQVSSLQARLSDCEAAIREKDDRIAELQTLLERQTTATTLAQQQAVTASSPFVKKTEILSSHDMKAAADADSNDSPSEGSVQLVNHSDANSLYTDEDSRHGEKTILVSRGERSATTSVANRVATNSAGTSSKTAPYLAALDDEEEDGWT